MTTIVSSNEVRNSLGRLLKLAADENEEIVIKVRGEPKAALLSYADYEKWVEMNQRQKGIEALQKIRAVREQILQKTAPLSDAEAYQLAGFGEQATEEILRVEQRNNSSE